MEGGKPCSGDNLLTKTVAHVLGTKHSLAEFEAGDRRISFVGHFRHRGRYQTSPDAVGICTSSICLSHKPQG